jgi:hypothetical protein
LAVGLAKNRGGKRFSVFTAWLPAVDSVFWSRRVGDFIADT